jgi:hypothetical protein
MPSPQSNITGSVPTFNTGLPLFFQTGGNIVFEPLEEIRSPDDEVDFANMPELGNIAQDNDDEPIPHGLLEFFHGVNYNDMEEHFRAFEYGRFWNTNPIFTDEFAVRALPSRVANMVYELHSILDIRSSGVVRNDYLNDVCYDHLAEEQQHQLRKIVVSNPGKYRKLDDLYNRLTGYRSFTRYPEVKFVLNKIIDVVLCLRE